MLSVTGLVESAQRLSLEDLKNFADQIQDVSAIVPGRVGRAIHFRELLAKVGVSSSAKFVTLQAEDGFFASLPLGELNQALVVYSLDGSSLLPTDKGGPLRFLIPNVEHCSTEAREKYGLDKCANVKHLRTMHITEQPGRDNRPTSDDEHEALHH